MNISELHALWKHKRTQIEKHIGEFRAIGRTACDDDLFAELVFCLFTPQSRALSCWAAVKQLKKDKVLKNGKQDRIARIIGGKGVRFKNNKARYVVEARRLTSVGSNSLRSILETCATPFEARLWLVKNVKGLGLKEASHFLRNIGYGDDLSILDRHILKNLMHLGVIRTIPKNLSQKIYIDIEKKMVLFSKKINIPLGHLDLVLWYNETGTIFK
ncbi:MAG: N-glycosylase/DNA lyase [Endomicrobiales bacterium]|jgi:N-glycosylase/DNA lyase